MIFTFEDEEFKRMMKNSRRKLELPMPAAMPCKLQRDIIRTRNLVCSWRTQDRVHLYC